MVDDSSGEIILRVALARAGHIVDEDLLSSIGAMLDLGIRVSRLECVCDEARAENDRLRSELAAEGQKRREVAEENYGLMLMLSDSTGVSAGAIRATARSRALREIEGTGGSDVNS